jgi:hypothetical protein
MSQHVDPRLNCASEICCPPRALAYNQSAHDARVEILLDLGAPAELAQKMAREMPNKGVCFLPQALADVIREIAFP